MFLPSTEDPSKTASLSIQTSFLAVFSSYQDIAYRITWKRKEDLAVKIGARAVFL